MSTTTPAASSTPRALVGPTLPRTVPADVDETVGDCWRARLAQHTGDWYAVPVSRGRRQRPRRRDDDVCAAGFLALRRTRGFRDWLDTPDGAAFSLRRDLELHGVTSSPSGWLQRQED